MSWHVLWYVLWYVLVVCIEFIPACIQYEQVTLSVFNTYQSLLACIVLVLCMYKITILANTD